MAPTSFQTTDPFDGSTFFGSPALDAGACAYFELDVKAGVTINQLGLNFLNGGEGPFSFGTGLYYCPNLIGTTARVEWWMVDLTGGLNGGLVLSNIPQTYSITNGTAPLAPWTLGAASNLTVAAADTPSNTSAFSLHLNPGTYGVCLVTVPNGTAFGSTATNAFKLHPLFRNVGIGSPLLVAEDQTFKLTSRGVRSLAFASGPAGQYMPNIIMSYALDANSAYYTKYGSGCYDRKKSFYESSVAPPVPGITPAPAALGGISMIPLGSPVNQYVVTPGAGYPLTVPNSTVWYGAATHVNNYTPGPVYTNPPAQNLFGGWDDSISTAYTLPFATAFPHPGGSFTQISVCSNGVVYCGPNATAAFASGGPRIQMFGLFTELVGGPPAYCAAFGDLWPDDGTGGAGQMYVDSDATTATDGTYVTVSWVGVREYPNAATGGTLGSSFQIRFNSTGTVDYAWGTVTHSDSAPMTIGYTAGDGQDTGAGLPQPRLAVPSPTGGLTSMAGALAAGGGSFLSGNGDKPPILTTVARPKHGSSLQMTSSNLDPSIMAVLTFISSASIPGGLDLGGLLGMPGCNAYIVLPSIVDGLDLNLGAPTVTANFGTVPAIVGDFYAQSAGLSIAVPAFNALNVLVSNAVCLHVDAN